MDLSHSFPDLSIDDFTKLVKNFIDMLILASGYQSTGRLAHWDSHNVRRCFHWALFIENVSKLVMSSSDYRDFVRELDAALSELSSNPALPRDFANLSCGTLNKARDLLLERLIQTLPLRDSHLKAILKGSIEMDISEAQRIIDDPINLYFERLMRIPADEMKSSEERNINNEYSDLVIKQLGKRQLAVSVTSDMEKGLENLWNTLEKSMNVETGVAFKSEPEKHSSSLLAEELPMDPLIWNQWKSRSMSYTLDKWTMRLVAGASLIFSESEGQWNQIFKQINNSADNSASVGETIELLLLGCTLDRWSTRIEQLMSVSYEPLTISSLYHEVFISQEKKLLNLSVKDGLIDSKERRIVDYLELLLDAHPNLLWKLPPVLAAIAIPVWSQLFRSYLHELDGQFRGSVTRCCSCVTDKSEHRECEVTERIWCLYIFHTSRYLTASGTA